MSVFFSVNVLFPNVTGLRKMIVASMEHYGNSQISSWATACQFSHQEVIKGGGKMGQINHCGPLHTKKVYKIELFPSHKKAPNACYVYSSTLGKFGNGFPDL